MIALHLIFGGGDKPAPVEEVSAPVAVEDVVQEEPEDQSYLDILDYEASSVLAEAVDELDAAVIEKITREPKQINTTKIVKQNKQSWKDNAVPVDMPKRGGKVVIIIDDMGMSHDLSQQTIDLPAPLTLAFLPYAPNLESMTERAHKKGHELMIHMPMEPMNPDLDVGSIALLDDMTEAQLQEAMEKAFNSFDHYVGINNHMGSRLTQNEQAMHVVMNELARRGLLFVDSKTISTSVAGKLAAQHGLDYAERDVFLDHENTDEFVADALQRLEHIARQKGYAIAIGHPKKVTVNGLKKWLPTLASKGLTVVPVSAVVKNDGTVKLTHDTEAVKAVLNPLPALSPLPQLQ